MREWGQVLLFKGKYKNHTHQKAYEKDLAYAVLMTCKFTFSNPWALNFRYALARLKQAARANREREELKEKMRNQTLMVHTKGDMERETETDVDSDSWSWKMCSPEGSAPKTTASASSKGRQRPRPMRRPGADSSTSHLGEGAGPEDVRAREVKRTAVKDDLQELGATESLKICQKIDNMILKIEEQLRPSKDQCTSKPAKYRLPELDVLEITAAGGSSISAAVQRHGGRAVVRNHATELGSARGPCDRLWQLISM